MRESFAEFWKKTLRTRSPAEYQRLLESGDLEPLTRETEANAQVCLESTLAALRQALPPPPGASALQVAAHLSNLASSAREIVLHDLAMENEELRWLDETGYVDCSARSTSL